MKGRSRYLHPMKRTKILAGIALAASWLAGCTEGTTAKLSPALDQRFAAESVVRRADDQIFRFTSDPGGRSERREDRRASIVVTKSTVFIHKNEKVGIEITPRTRREVAVERSGERVRIRSGRGASEETWSFVPPNDAAGWTNDIRAVIRQASK